MNRRAVWALTRRDLLSIVRNRGVILPLVIAPLLLLVVLPFILVAGGAGLADRAPVPVVSGTAFESLAEDIERGTATEVPEDTPAEGRWTLFVLEYFFAPLYLLVPLIVTTVIAADSFAGERDRKTLEALLHTPTDDRELLAAKLLSAWIPAIGAASAGFVTYGVIANLLAWPYVGGLFFPSVTWLLLFVWVSPPLAALALGCMVLVSSRVSSLQAAHQLGSLVVLPAMLLLVAGVSGAARFSPRLVVALGALLWLLAGAVLLGSSHLVTRDRLASRL